MKISRYSIFFDAGNDLKLAYCSRTNALFEISAQLFDFFRLNRNGKVDVDLFEEDVLSFLMEQKVIVHEEDDDVYVRELQFKTLQLGFSQEQLSLIIAPTTCCNFRCHYCFEPKKDQRVMEHVQIAQLVEFVQKHSLAKTMSITWYGGEPLLAIDVIRTLLQQFNKTGKTLVRHDIITNGYYFEEKAIEIFSEFPLNLIQVTLDGNQKRHDSIRVNYKTKERSFYRIISNMDRILEALPNTFLSVRVNVDKSSQEQFYEVKEFLSERWEKYSNYEIYPGILRIDNKKGADFSEESMNVFDAAAFSQKLEECGFANNYPTLLHKSCTANRINSYIIGPAGEIYKCWNDVTDKSKIVGFIHDDTLIHRQLFYDYLFSTAWYENAKCKECTILPICHGGCAWYKVRNLRANGHFETCCTHRDENLLKSSLINRYMQTKKNNMIFKKYLLFIFLSFIVITSSFSQARSVITGQVVTENGNAIRNVNVSILKDNVDSAIVALTTTDTLGRFSLKCNGGLKYLRFSCLGYLSKYMLVDTGDVGSVVLVETSLDIEGVVVKGRSKIYRPDGITYLPTDRRVSNSVNGMDLLSSMKPPRIYVDPVSYNISVRGGGDVVLLINDRPATSGEIQSIDPELIRRIDYYDKPTPRFPLASIVINLTVDLPAKGGAVNVNITEGISNTYGEHYVIGRVYNGRHSFMIDWQPQFRYSFSQMRERFDYFNFPSETISRNEIAIPARQIYWHNNSSAHYNYTGRKIMLDIAGFGQFDRDKNNDFAGRVITKTSSKSDTTINSEHNFERNTTQGISTYIEVKSPIGPLYINADYSLRSAKYKREFEEFSSINPFFSSNSNSEEIHLTGLQGNYNAPLPLGEIWSGMLSISSSWRSRWISNSYSSLGVEPVAVNMRQNNGENKIMLMVMGDKLMLALGAVHFWQNYSIDDYTKRWSQWLPIGAISLSPTKTWTVDLDAMLKYSQPPIGELTISEIRLDPYQVQRGNPNLTNTRLLQFTLNNTLELTSKYELFVQGKYRQIQNPIMDISFLEQQADLSYIVVRMPENLNKFTQYTASCSLEGTEIWNFLSFSLWGGFSHYISDGGSVYEHEAFIPFCQGQFNIKWRKWDFVSEMWYGQTDAQMGEVLKSKSLHSRFIVSSQYGKLRVSVGVMNPFLKVRDVKYENLSAIAPYTRYAYNQMYENLFFAKLTYLFSWGSEQRKRGKPKFKATEQETTIIKGER